VRLNARLHGNFTPNFARYLIFNKKLETYRKKATFAPPILGNDGDVAQSVEQRTENPCVDGSIPPITTKTPFCVKSRRGFLFGGLSIYPARIANFGT
jgi:hypothetical protein